MSAVNGLCVKRGDCPASLDLAQPVLPSADDLHVFMLRSFWAGALLCCIVLTTEKVACDRPQEAERSGDLLLAITSDNQKRGHRNDHYCCIKAQLLVHGCLFRSISHCKRNNNRAKDQDRNCKNYSLMPLNPYSCGIAICVVGLSGAGRVPTPVIVIILFEGLGVFNTLIDVSCIEITPIIEIRQVNKYKRFYSVGQERLSNPSPNSSHSRILSIYRSTLSLRSFT